VIFDIILAAGSFAFPPAWAFIMVRIGPSPRTRREFLARWAAGGFGGAITSSIAALPGGGWLYPLSFGASGLVGLILWWLSRRKRRRSLKALGGRALKALAAMLRNMPRPGPVLRPVPQGARA
jgi:hypothetical protein